MSGWRRGTGSRVNQRDDDCLNILVRNQPPPAARRPGPASIVTQRPPRQPSHRRTVAFLATLLRLPDSHARPEKKSRMPVLITKRQTCSMRIPSTPSHCLASSV